MSVTYTNRKNITYYLCRSVTRTGRPRYYFSPRLQGEPVEQVPEGYKIGETANGMVVLKRDRPQKITPYEVQVVEDALRRHPRSGDYRVEVKGDRIEVFEAIGPNADELRRLLGSSSIFKGERLDRVVAIESEHRRFAPVLRFILADEEKRIFRVERRCYSSSLPDWVEISSWSTLEQHTRQIVPRLGTEKLFEIY